MHPIKSCCTAGSESAHNLATNSCICFHTLTLLVFHCYSIALGLQWSYNVLTNDCNVITNGTPVTLFPCYIAGNLQEVTLQNHLLPRFNLSSQYVVVI